MYNIRRFCEFVNLDIVCLRLSLSLYPYLSGQNISLYIYIYVFSMFGIWESGVYKLCWSISQNASDLKLGV